MLPCVINQLVIGTDSDSIRSFWIIDRFGGLVCAVETVEL